MHWTFTAAADRVLSEAAGWSSCDDRDDLDEPELLLGLLAESECRAATMLLARGIDAAAVHKQWPSLRRAANDDPRPRELSPAVVVALQAAADRLWEYPQPLTLATEHVLLGLVASAGETAAWLVERGFDADALEREIHRLYGHDPRPLPLDVGTESELPADADQSSPQSISALPSPAETAQHIAAQSTVAIYRVIDAAANRAREGLRVVEDFVRLVLGDQHLTREIKKLRHDLRGALDPLAQQDLVVCRDTLSDVGTEVSTAAEMSRTDVASVAAANWKRLQEALRSLEEFGKVVAPSAAASIEMLRYRTYTLERAVFTTTASRQRLAYVRLCALVDGRSSDDEFLRLVEALVVAGVSMVQLRDKALDDRELVARARRLRAATRRSATVCVINDRPDIASLVGADGVHLGQEDLPVHEARRIVGPRALIGVSTHSIEQARQAVLAGADYIGVGPTFPSTTKQFAAQPGLPLLAAVAAEIGLPALAIGGIDLDNIAAVLATGTRRVAVSGAVLSASDPAAAAAELLRRLDVGGK